MLAKDIPSTNVSRLFFSQVNLDALQLGIQNMVLNESEGKLRIGRQSDQELLSIMRALYLKHGKNLPHAVVEQVRTLNNDVLRFAVPRIMNELEMYKTYRKDAQDGPTFFDRPASTNTAGTKIIDVTKR